MKRRNFIKAVMASALVSKAPPLLPSEGLKLSIDQTENGDNTEVTRERDFFYRPQDAWAADFIPYYRDGQFHLFFLLDWRDRLGHGEGTPWFKVSTADFVHFVEQGQMLQRGTKQQQDLYVFTGSVLFGEGQHHIFYTGHNPYLRAQGKPEQGIMHAVSSDLINWSKVPEDTFFAPEAHYEPHDWRDPFVFWNDEAKEYWMLLAARLKDGPSRRRGCTALCSSPDLRKWTVREPLWTPGLYFTHECPDLFRINDWWYLVFSEFTDMVRTRYRMSRSIQGPWITPTYDYFDGRAFYAAKTASDGQRRFLFGWVPTRTKDRDYGRWDWGGNLAVHELVQETDGALTITVPRLIDESWRKQLPYTFSRHFGNVVVKNNAIELNASSSFSCAAGEIAPARFKMEAQVQFASGTRACGIMLRASDDLEECYYIRLEPENRRLVFDSWPRGSGSDQPIMNGDGEYMAGLDRWIDINPNEPIDLKMIVDKTIAIIYVDRKTALSVRMCNRRTGRCGVFVEQGSAQFENIRITEL